MKFYYLDHNIYIYSLSDARIGSAVETLKQSNIQFLYSPAHIEEVYKAQKENGESYRSTAKRIIDTISLYTDNNECLPSDTEIVIKREYPNRCYKRVADIDTTERTASDGKDKYITDKNNFDDLIRADKHNQSISTVPYNKIWEQAMIANNISNLNQNMPAIIRHHNTSLDVFICALMGVNKLLPEDLKIAEGSYLELSKAHAQFEFVMELLFRVLNYCGYYADKSEGTTVSGIHDVTHAIYATKAQKLFTTDKRFAQKCSAVYYYLGIPTQVILCPCEQIAKILRDNV